MKKEDVLNLMTDLPPDLIEEADLDAPAKRRLPKLARMGLIAACLCLALIGTAAAVHYMGVSIVDGENGVTYLQGGVAYYPYDSLSEQVKALEGVWKTASGCLIRTVPSWQAAEDFIGVNLMDNPLLDASPATRFGHIYDGVNSPFMVILNGPELSSARVYGCYEIGEANILVEANLFTDRQAALSEDWDQRFQGYDFSHIEGMQVCQDTYTAPSGLEARILELTRPDEDGASYKAACSLNGIPTVVSVDDGDARAVLLQVLDGFELSPDR